jgi:trans-aconitate methyltransferase
MGTPWGAYDRTSQPQQAWASEVLARLDGIAQDASVLDVGCGTGRVTEALLALVPRGRVLATDQAREMVVLAQGRSPWIFAGPRERNAGFDTRDSPGSAAGSRSAW